MKINSSALTIQKVYIPEPAKMQGKSAASRKPIALSISNWENQTLTPIVPIF